MNRAEVKKAKQAEGLKKLYELVTKLESKGMTVSDISDKANISGNKLYELLRQHEPRGFNNLSPIIEKLEILNASDVDMNVSEYAGLHERIKNLESKLDRIILLLTI